MSESAPQTPPAEQGSLDEHPLASLLLRLYRRRESGELVLSREAVEKRIWLREGVPVLSESNIPSESLGIQLLDSGAISREDYARVVDAVRKRRCREGAALLGLGLVGPKALYEALKRQLRTRIVDCLGWTRGAFAFTPGVVPAEDTAAFRCDPTPLVQEGVAIHWSAAAIRSALGSVRDRFATATPRTAVVAGRLHASPELEALLPLLDGRYRLGELVEPLRDPSALAAIFVLDAMGALAYADERSAATPEPAADAEPRIEIVVGGPATSQAPAPPAAPGPAPTHTRGAASVPPAHAALREEVLALHASLGERDHYALLGLERDATIAVIRRAYFAAAKRFHPDAIGRLGLHDLGQQAQALFARISEAHEVLADPETRQAYDRSLAGGGDVDVERVVQAETLYRKAEILLRAGNFAGALEFLRPAIALWPDECAYQSAIGWALFKKSPPEPETARTHLEQAVALDATDALAHHRLGGVLRALGETQAADAALARARQLDPKLRA